MNEVALRLAIAASLVCGCLLVSTPASGSVVELAAGILIWSATALFIQNYVSSPTLRIAPHFRAFGLFLLACATSIVLALQVAYDTTIPSADVALGSLLIIFSCVSLCLVYLLPVPTMYTLGGKYRRIGTSSFNIQMQLPATAYCYKDKTQYNMCVQVWYPVNTEATSALRSFFFPKTSVLWTSGHPQQQDQEAQKLLTLVADNAKLPALLFARLALARTSAEFFTTVDKGIFPCPSEKGYPTVVYSHGMYSWRQHFTSTAEALASNGFVVFSIDHSPSAMVVRPFEDLASSEKYDELKLDGEAERSYYRGGMDRRAREVMFLIDHISRPDVARSFSINPSLISVCGHSYGGGTSALVASRDKRVIAAAMLDSWMYPMPDGDRKRGSVGAAIAFINSHVWDVGHFQAPFRSDFCKNSVEKGKNMAVRVTLLESDHQNYCDSQYFAARPLLARQNFLGKLVDHQRVTTLYDQILVRFFARTCELRSTQQQAEPDRMPAVAIDNLPPLSSSTQGGDTQTLLKYCFDCSSDLVQPFPRHLLPFASKQLVDTDSLGSEFYSEEYFDKYPDNTSCVFDATRK